VHAFRFPAVGDALCPWPVRDVGEGVIGHLIRDASRELAAASCVVAADLHRQAARSARTWHKPVLRPRNRSSSADTCRHPEPERFAGLLVMPRLVGGAGLHREKMHTSPPAPALRQDLAATDLPCGRFRLRIELDRDASVRRICFGVLPNPVPERLGELRVVEDANFRSNRNAFISPAKQTPGKVPKISIRSSNQHASNLPACRPL